MYIIHSGELVIFHKINSSHKNCNTISTQNPCLQRFPLSTPAAYGTSCLNCTAYRSHAMCVIQCRFSLLNYYSHAITSALQYTIPYLSVHLPGSLINHHYPTPSKYFYHFPQKNPTYQRPLPHSSPYNSLENITLSIHFMCMKLIYRKVRKILYKGIENRYLRLEAIYIGSLQQLLRSAQKQSVASDTTETNNMMIQGAIRPPLPRDLCTEHHVHFCFCRRFYFNNI